MQTWDMNQALRVRNGERGIIPIPIPGIGPYQCKDGWVYGYIGAPGGAPWSVLREWMEEEGMAEDLVEPEWVEFIDNLNLRFLTTLTDEPAKIPEKMQKLGHIGEVLTRFIASKSKWDMYEGGQNRRLLFGIVSTPEDIADNPQLKHRQWLTSIRHDDLDDTLQYPGPPYRLSESPWAVRSRPPLIGEHNRAIFGDELGVSDDEWQSLTEAGAV